MNQTQRHSSILALLKKAGFVSTEALVEAFNVTPQTLRRDLNILADNQLIKRVHGGATIFDSSTENAPYQARKQQNDAAKHKIAQQVAALIPNDASLFINIGTTNEAVAQALLQHQNLRIVTNNIHAARILSSKPDFSVIIAGGEVRYTDGGIIGEATRDFISQFHVDFCVIGISGISESGALLDFDFREVKVSQAMLKNAQHRILACDASKFGRQAMVEQARLAQVDTFVCDQPAPKTLQAIIDSHDIRFLTV